MSFACIVCDHEVEPERAGLEAEAGDMMLRGFCDHCQRRTMLRVVLLDLTYRDVQDDDGEAD